jgi:hypothetical protein
VPRGASAAILVLWPILTAVASDLDISTAVAGRVFGMGGSLVFMGAVFADSYDLSVSVTGIVLAGRCSSYVPGTSSSAPRRSVASCVALALGAAVTVATLGSIRSSLSVSFALSRCSAFSPEGALSSAGPAPLLP